MIKKNIYYVLRKRFRELQLNANEESIEENINEFNDLMVEFFDLKEIKIDEETLDFLNKAKQKVQLAQDSKGKPQVILIRRAVQEVDKILVKKLKEEGGLL